MSVEWQFDFNLFKDIIGVIKDIALTVGAITTTAIGVYGLTIWKRDLVGKEAYTAIRALVKQLHLASRQANKLRRPVLLGEHRVATEVETEHLTAGERWRKFEAEIYQQRLKDFEKVYNDLQDSSLDARVLIGSVIYRYTVPFNTKIAEAIALVNDYLDVLYDQKLALTEDSPVIKSAQLALYPGEKLDDKLSQETSATREAAEKELLKFLHRKNIAGTATQQQIKPN